MLPHRGTGELREFSFGGGSGGWWWVGGRREEILHEVKGTGVCQCSKNNRKLVIVVWTADSQQLE